MIFEIPSHLSSLKWENWRIKENRDDALKLHLCIMIHRLLPNVVQCIFSRIDLFVNDLLHNRNYPDLNFNFLYISNFVGFQRVISWILLKKAVDACFSYQLVLLKFINTYYSYIELDLNPTILY